MTAITTAAIIPVNIFFNLLIMSANLVLRYGIFTLTFYYTAAFQSIVKYK